MTIRSTIASSDQIRHIEQLIRLDRIGANDKIAVRVRGDEKAHVTEDPCTLAVIPGQVDCCLGDKSVASNADGTLLFLVVQRSEVCFREFEDVDDKVSRHDVALMVPRVDGTFCYLGDLMPIRILSAGVYMDRQDPRRGVLVYENL